MKGATFCNVFLNIQLRVSIKINMLTVHGALSINRKRYIFSKAARYKGAKLKKKQGAARAKLQQVCIVLNIYKCNTRYKVIPYFSLIILSVLSRDLGILRF